MATEAELAQALSPAFGVYPKAFRGNYGNPQDAANLPVDVLRGRTAGLLGMFGDVVNQPIAFPLARAAQLAIQGLLGQEQYKYPDTEKMLKALPFAPTSRVGEVAGQAASFVPLNPAPAVRAIGAAGRALEPTAANMAEGYLQKQGLMPGMLPPSKYVGATLEGMPDVVNVGGKMEQFGTDQRLVDIAKSYVADKGLVYSPQTKYATIDEDRATRLAQAYEGMLNNPNDPRVKKSYNAMIEETMAQYEALRKKGYKFDFMPESGDIYGNPRNAINDIVQNKRLSIFPTEQGFGGPSAATASEANPLLMRTGETWNGKPVTANDVFRAVHDVFGHGKHGVGFRAGGEENAFQSHARMYSPEALPAATSETRGQNSWVNYGPFGEFNKNANPLLTEYAEQKTGLMPAWTWREGLLK
jgi:hypothetical protein